ncbi:MAG: translocation/assembly module TamB [Bacteroidia bacterium]|nr:translocation/assembly module TamB [Bacteroidia bacterium]MDW8346719.1 hypothetical protein [Bacteroidia bacterium]
MGRSTEAKRSPQHADPSASEGHAQKSNIYQMIYSLNITFFLTLLIDLRFNLVYQRIFWGIKHGTIILTVFILFILGAVQTEHVQNVFARIGAEYLSHKLGTPVKIGHVRIILFDKVLLENVEILDQQKNTLFSVEKVELSDIGINLKKKRIFVHQTEIIAPAAHIYRRNKDSIWNYQYILDAFASTDTTSSKNSGLPWAIIFTDAKIRNLRFLYADSTCLKNPPTPTYLAFDNLNLENTDIDFSFILDEKGTIKANICHFTAHERSSGIHIKHFSTGFEMSDTLMKANHLRLITDRSDIHLSASIQYKKINDIGNFNNKVTLHLYPSVYELDDIAMFAENYHDLKGPVKITTRIDGRLNKLNIRNMDIEYAEHTKIHLQGRVNGLPDIETTIFDVRLDSTYVMYDDFNRMMPSVAKDLPTQIKKLGKTRLDLKYTGFYHNFVTNGFITTKYGLIRPDLQYNINTDEYSGKLVLKDFNLAKALEIDSTQINQLDLETEIKGKGFNPQSMELEVSTLVSQVNVLGFGLVNVNSAFKIQGATYRGELSIQDSTWGIYAKGFVDKRKDTLPIYDLKGRVYKLDLKRFKATPHSFYITTDFVLKGEGDNENNLKTDLLLNNTSLEQLDRKLFFEGKSHLTLDYRKIDSNTIERDLTLYTPFVSGSVKGNYIISELITEMGSMVYQFTDYFKHKLDSTTQTLPGAGMDTSKVKEQLVYEIQMRKAKPLLDFIDPTLPLDMAENTLIKGHAKIDENFIFDIEEISSDSIVYDNMRFNKVKFDLTASKRKNIPHALGMLNLSVEEYIIGKDTATHLKNINFGTVWLDSMFTFRTGLKHLPTQHEVKLNGKGRFSRNNLFVSLKNSALLLHGCQYLTSTEQKEVVKDTTIIWKMSDNNRITLRNGFYKIENFSLQNLAQKLEVEGTISDNPKDVLTIYANKLDLSELGKVLQIKGLDMKGTAELSTDLIYTLSDSLKIVSNGKVRDFIISDLEVGTIDLYQVFDNKRQTLTLKKLHILEPQYDSQGKKTGYRMVVSQPRMGDKEKESRINLANKEKFFDLHFVIDTLYIKKFEPFLAGEIDSISRKSFITGKLNIAGSQDSPSLLGGIGLHNFRFRVKYTNTYYQLSMDRQRFTNINYPIIIFKHVGRHDEILFSNLVLQDCELLRENKDKISIISQKITQLQKLNQGVFPEYNKILNEIKQELEYNGYVTERNMAQIEVLDSAYKSNKEFSSRLARDFRKDLHDLRRNLNKENLPQTNSLGGTAKISGVIYHEGFNDIYFNINRIIMDKFLALNTTLKDNSLYYGRAFVSTLDTTRCLRVRGALDHLKISGEVSTDVGTYTSGNLSIDNDRTQTVINLPLGSSNEVSEKSYIRFVKDTSDLRAAVKTSLSGIEMDVLFKLRENTNRFRVIFDEKTGDVIDARTKGEVRMTINSIDETFEMNGGVEVIDGNYLFTAENIIKKRFILQKGGTIVWDGDPVAAKLNLSAAYYTRAPAKDLNIGISEATNFNRLLPVAVIMNMTGSLSAPVFRTDIEFPGLDVGNTSELSLRLNRLKAQWNLNEQERNQQVFSLLVLNRFVTPSDIPQVNNTNIDPSFVAASTGIELLSNELSLWLSQLTPEMDIRIALGQQKLLRDADITLGKNFFSNRIRLERTGTLFNPNDPNSNRISAGNLTLRVRLDNLDRFNLEFFNRVDNFNSFAGTNNVQGVGLFYRQSFDNPTELWSFLHRNSYEEAEIARIRNYQNRQILKKDVTKLFQDIANTPKNAIALGVNVAGDAIKFSADQVSNVAKTTSKLNQVFKRKSKNKKEKRNDNKP